MNQKTILLSAIALLLSLLFSFEASATIRLVPCNGCSAEGMQRAAELSQNRIGSSNIAVVNFRDYTAQKFFTSLRFGDYGEPVTNATAVNFTTDEQHDIDLYFRFREALGDYIANFSGPLYESSIETKSGYISSNKSQRFYNSSNDEPGYVYGGVVKVKGDPYNFLSSSFKRNDVYDWFMNGAKGNVLEILDSSLQAVEIPTGKDLDLYLDVVFYTSSEDLDNGNQNGKVKVALDTINEVFVIMSAKDADNNSIPIVKDELGGEYRFKFNENSEVFLRYINLMFDSTPGSTPACVVTSRRMVGDNFIYTYRCG